MPRYRGRFEVKREMSDGDKIRLDKDRLTDKQIEIINKTPEEEELYTYREPDLSEKEIEAITPEEEELYTYREPDLSEEETEIIIPNEEELGDYREPDLSEEETEIIIPEEEEIGDYREPDLAHEKAEGEQKKIEIKLDENGNPIIPKDWTFLIHGSSLERWDASELGKDFIVGKGIINGKETNNRALCCVERNLAKFDFQRDGSNTAEAYGGKEDAFQIRVLFYKNPRLGEGKEVKEKLSPEKLKDVTKYYMYQGGRHPAVPAGTKLIFLENGNFDEITQTSNNKILWYIPQEYLEEYLEDVRQKEEKDEIKPDEVEKEKNYDESKVEDEASRIARLKAEAEKDILECYTEDMPIGDTKAYLSEKIKQIYGDNLSYAAIYDVDKYLEDKLYDFDGVDSYRKIIEEIESGIEFGKKLEEKQKQEDNGPSLLEEMEEMDPKEDKISISKIGKATINTSFTEKESAIKDVKEKQRLITQMKEDTIHDK